MSTDAPGTQSVGDRLRHWRTAIANEGAGISQGLAASLVEVSQPTWCDWEQGKKEPRIKNALLIEQITDGFVTVAMWAQDSLEATAEVA